MRAAIERFGHIKPAHHAPLYERLCQIITADADLLAVWSRSPPPADGSAEIWLIAADGGAGEAQRLTCTDPHGWWIEWGPDAKTVW